MEPGYEEGKAEEKISHWMRVEYELVRVVHRREMIQRGSEDR